MSSRSYSGRVTVPFAGRAASPDSLPRVDFPGKAGVQRAGTCTRLLLLLRCSAAHPSSPTSMQTARAVVEPASKRGLEQCAHRVPFVDQPTPEGCECDAAPSRRNSRSTGWAKTSSIKPYWMSLSGFQSRCMPSGSSWPALNSDLALAVLCRVTISSPSKWIDSRRRLNRLSHP